ncbi:uncharacterized protein LOC144920989 isoform X1 [Branchiostoma floridae x Branchiostoma belcheri]
MPRRRKVPKTKRLSAWKAKQEVERLADEQEAEITDQEPAVEQEVEVIEEELSDEQEVEGQAVTWLEDPAQSIQQMGPLLGKEAELGPGETDRGGTSHQQKDTAHSICMVYNFVNNCIYKSCKASQISIIYVVA